MIKDAERQNEIEQDDASRFAAIQYVSKGYYLHFHRNLEIYGVVKGKVVVTIGGRREILTDGQIDPKKLKPITYDPVNHTYIGLGEKVGNAFKDGLALK